MCGALVESVCICRELGLEHQVVELGDSEGAPLATSKDLGLKQEAAVDIDHYLSRTLQVYVEERQTIVTLKVL